MRKKSKPFVCPHCGVDKYKSLKSGSVTRCCGRKVARVNGGVFKNLDEAPEWQLLQAFVEEKRKRGLKRYDVPYGSSTYREAVPVMSLLMDKCGGDLELALLCIDISFNDPKHQWRDYLTFFSLISAKYFPDVLARARKDLGRKRSDRELQHHIANQQVNEAWRVAYESARREAAL